MAKKKLHFISNSEIQANRGFIVEDYHANKLKIVDLVRKYKCTIEDVEDILAAYYENSPVTIKAFPTDPPEETLSEIISRHKTLSDFTDYCEKAFFGVKTKEFESQVEMAKAIGVHERTVYNMLTKFGIEKPHDKKRKTN